MKMNVEYIEAMKALKTLAQNNEVPKDEANELIVALSDIIENLLQQVGFKEG